MSEQYIEGDTDEHFFDENIEMFYQDFEEEQIDEYSHEENYSK